MEKYNYLLTQTLTKEKTYDIFTSKLKSHINFFNIFKILAPV